jgi:hypothetical protein
MKFKVLKPTPGTGYSIGETAGFDKEQSDEWLKLGYIEPIKSTPETGTVKPSETAKIPDAAKKR